MFDPRYLPEFDNLGGCLDRPIAHNLLHVPDERAVVVCDEGDVDPRPDAALPLPDGQSDAGETSPKPT